MKFLLFGIVFFVLSALFAVFFPGLFKIIAFFPLSISFICFFIAGIQEKIRSMENRNEEKRKAALLRVAGKLKLSRVPRDINELMEAATGRETEAFAAYEQELGKKLG